MRKSIERDINIQEKLSVIIAPLRIITEKTSNDARIAADTGQSIYHPRSLKRYAFRSDASTAATTKSSSRTTTWTSVNVIG